MADLRFDYQQIESLISSCAAVYQYFSTQGLAPLPGSVDALAEYHVDSVHAQEDAFIIVMVNSSTVGQDGAEATYEDFKAADSVEEV